jgi:hypothetical protein
VTKPTRKPDVADATSPSIMQSDNSTPRVPDVKADFERIMAKEREKESKVARITELLRAAQIPHHPPAIVIDQNSSNTFRWMLKKCVFDSSGGSEKHDNPTIFINGAGHFSYECSYTPTSVGAGGVACSPCDWKRFEFSITQDARYHEIDAAQTIKWINDEKEVVPSQEDALRDLARLTDEQYESVREKAAKRLGIRKSKLDGYVSQRKQQSEQNAPTPEAGSLTLENVRVKLSQARDTDRRHHRALDTATRSQSPIPRVRSRQNSNLKPPCIVSMASRNGRTAVKN